MGRILKRLECIRQSRQSIHESGNAANAGEQFDQEFLPLAVELGGEHADPGRIAARMRHRSHEAFADHVIGIAEDGNRRRCLLRGAKGGWPGAQNDIDLGLGQLRRILRELVGS
jgi:hypothetical protein